jgi:hypothetical protein
MNKAIWVIVFLLLLAGCAKEQDLTEKNGSIALVQEEAAIEEKIIEAGTEGTAASQESGMQVAPPVAIVQEMQAQIKKAQEPAAPIEPAGEAEEIIAANRWGFSVYDPQTGIEEFYTSSGALLGSKKR